MGGSLDDWLRRPWEYVLYWYLTTQERDRVQTWLDEMHHMAAAELIGVAFHKPEALPETRRAIEWRAAGPLGDTKSYRERVELQAAEIMRARLVHVS